ncbi:hypothetical protein WN48_00483 [Eufriesea mexicana]|nr:hypothetical protein WN48_00483 [Eufriesea mexicana]
MEARLKLRIPLYLSPRMEQRGTSPDILGHYEPWQNNVGHRGIRVFYNSIYSRMPPVSSALLFRYLLCILL